MSKMNIFSAVSNRVLAAIKQSRVIISESQLGLFIVLITKSIADALGISEAVSKLFGKGLTDSPQAADQIAKSVATGKTDSATSADSTQLATGKVFSDLSNTSDAETKAIGKGLNEPIGTSEAKSFNVTKALSNTVYVTDDVGGEATIDDDQTIAFFKVLSNQSLASDAISLAAAYNRQFNNSGAVGDTVNLISAYSRSFNSGVSITDQILLQIILPISLSDSAFASDSLQSTAVYSRSLDDAVAGLDAEIFTVGSGQIDNGLVGDQADLVVSFNRAFESMVIATDDIGGEATTDDDQTIQFFKQLTNLTQTMDSAIRFAGKAVSDILGTADFGTLLNQDYVDNPFYFAEDYVGVKRTF
jgi:hypothetical protein